MTYRSMRGEEVDSGVVIFEEGRARDSEMRGVLLKNKLQLVKKKDGRMEVAPVEEVMPFDKGFFLFVRAIQLLLQKNEGFILIGIAGPSGAGKTVFTEKLSEFLPGTACLSMDMYNDASKIIDDNFDDPRLTDYETLLQNLHDLKQGQTVQIPIYDFKSSSRTGYREQKPPSSRVIVLEGIYALNEKIRKLLDLRISITGGVHFDLVKRVIRDVERSAQAPENIVQQISETVYPMYKAFIEPDLETAHIRITNNFNPFSGLMQPMYILKSDVEVDEEKARSLLIEYGGEKISEETQEPVDIYLLPPGEDPHTCQTWIRMRNCDGKYSLMFEECLVDGDFIISPRISFGVSVKILGGLMALGYTNGPVMKRTSRILSNEKLIVKFDYIEHLGHRRYVQVISQNRALVQEICSRMGMDGHYIPRSYIEQVQLEQLTSDFLTSIDETLELLNIPQTIVEASPCITPTQSVREDPFKSFSTPSKVISAQPNDAIMANGANMVNGRFSPDMENGKSGGINSPNLHDKSLQTPGATGTVNGDGSSTGSSSLDDFDENVIEIEEDEWRRRSAQTRKIRSRKGYRGSIQEGSTRRLQIWNDEDDQSNGKEARTDASLSLGLLSSLRDIVQGVGQTVQNHGQRLKSVQLVVQDMDQRLKEVASRQLSLESDMKTLGEILRNGSGYYSEPEAPIPRQNSNKEFAVALAEAITKNSNQNSYKLYITAACGLCLLGGFAVGLLMPSSRKK